MWNSLLMALIGGLGIAVPVAAQAQADPCTPGRSAFGPSFVVPLELAQGVTLGRRAPAPYAASVRIYPTYVLDRKRQLRAAAEAGIALANPALEGLLGGRISKSVFELSAGPIRGVGAHLGIEALYGTTGRALLGGALILDAGGAFQVTVRADQDVTNDATLLELGLGIHLYTGPTPEQTTPLPPTPTTYLGRVGQRAARAVKAAIGIARNESVSACTELVSAARAFVAQPSPDLTTIAEFRQALRNTELALVEGELLDPPPPPPDISERDVVAALYRGMAEGIETPGGL